MRACMSFENIFPYIVDNSHINWSTLSESINNTQQILTGVWLWDEKIFRIYINRFKQ